VIPTVAELRQRTLAALEVGRTDVIKHQNAVLEMTAGQAVLDPDLALQQPIQRLIGLVILDLAEAQNRAQTRHCRLFIHRSHKAQLRPRRDHAIDHHRQHQIAIAPRRSVLRRTQNQTVQHYLTDHSQHRSNMAVRQRALDLQFIRACPNQRASLEDRLQHHHHIVRQLAQIDQRPLLGAAVLIAIALAQQHCRRGIPIRNRLNEHVRIESQAR
jgi:hypothetical protein